MSSDVIIRDGFLRFNSLRKSDEGTYRCFAQNEYGDADQVIQIYVRSRTQTPVEREEVVISPDHYSGEPGVEIVLRCSATPRGRVTWSKSGSYELPRNVYAAGEELTIRYATATDSGRYVCNVVFPSGTTRSSFAEVEVVARVNEVPPRITPLERKYSIVQGGDFELTCEANGSPHPTIVWSMVNFNLKFMESFVDKFIL